jgi:ATPase involved in DNA repair
MEWLKKILGEELYNQVMEVIKVSETEVKLANLSDGKYVSLDKFDKALADKEKAEKALASSQEDFQKQLDSVQRELGEFKKAAEGQEDFQAKIKTLSETLKDKEKEVASSVEELKNTKRDFAIKDALRTYKVIDPDDITPRLNLDTISFNDDGITGLKEQVEKIKETKPYLFESDTPPEDNKNKPPAKAGNHLENNNKDSNVGNPTDLRSALFGKYNMTTPEIGRAAINQPSGDTGGSGSEE